MRRPPPSPPGTYSDLVMHALTHARRPQQLAHMEARGRGRRRRLHYLRHQLRRSGSPRRREIRACRRALAVAKAHGVALCDVLGSTARCRRLVRRSRTEQLTKHFVVFARDWRRAPWRKLVPAWRNLRRAAARLRQTRATMSQTVGNIEFRLRHVHCTAV